MLDSIFYHRGITFSVEIARQGGKNELSAQLELLLLTLFMSSSRNLVKCAPTFKPQALISMARLKDRLNDAGFGNIWTTEQGYIIRLGDCRAIFLSAEESSNVVGNTAHILLEIDESQDVNKEKYNKDFKPMAHHQRNTVPLWHAWTILTLWRGQAVQPGTGKENGIKRHFASTGKSRQIQPRLPSYIETERERLVKTTPFRTQ